MGVGYRTRVPRLHLRAYTICGTRRKPRTHASVSASQLDSWRDYGDTASEINRITLSSYEFIDAYTPPILSFFSSVYSFRNLKGDNYFMNENTRQ